MATGFNWVGDTIRFPDGGPQKIVAHAIMGGLLAELTGSDFKTGAVAAGLNEALIPGMAKVAGENKDLQLMLSQLTGLLAAAAVDGDLNTGSKIAEKATAFNYLFHAELLEREQKLNTCASPADCQAVRDYYNNLDTTRNKEFGQYCRTNPAACLQVTKQLADEIPANEKLLHDGRGAGFDRSAALWEITRSNERAVNTGIIEKNRTDHGDGAAFLTELAADGLSQDRGLFSSTAGGKGGTTGVKVGVVGGGQKGIQKVPGFGEVDDFVTSQSANLNTKLGTKIGQGRLPYERSKSGVEQAKATVKDTLDNVTSVSPVIPSSTVRGGYDLIHVYSSKTNSTVSLRVLSNGKYEFDTLIPEKSSKF